MLAIEATAAGVRRAGHLGVRVFLIGALVVVLASATAIGPSGHPLLALPAALALLAIGALIAAWPRTCRFVALITGTVSIISLTATAGWLASPSHAEGGHWPLLHTAALMILVLLVCRWSPIRYAAAVGTVTVAAEAALALPVTGVAIQSWWQAVAVCGFWSLAGLVGAGSGCYLRWLDANRVRAVRLARRAQRVQLATDLHDFVAHDVSAMVIQVQAAQVLLDGDPDQVAQVLRRIESDGARALASMDRTIRVLRELEDATGVSRTTLPNAADLPDLVDRFAAFATGPVELNMDPGIDSALRNQAGTTVYRVVVEALTNVRRHAHPGAVVTVTLRRDGDGIALTVSDHAPQANPQPRHTTVRRDANDPHDQRRGGMGLAGLAERVETLGGTFAAGPVPPAGWRVRAELPSDVLEPTP